MSMESVLPPERRLVLVPDDEEVIQDVLISLATLWDVLRHAALAKDGAHEQ